MCAPLVAKLSRSHHNICRDMGGTQCSIYDLDDEKLHIGIWSRT